MKLHGAGGRNPLRHCQTIVLSVSRVETCSCLVQCFPGGAGPGGDEIPAFKASDTVADFVKSVFILLEKAGAGHSALRIS
jgi:hypothetical protein